LPGVLAFTYFITEFLIPRYFQKKQAFYLFISVVVVLILYPSFAFLERTLIVEPYVFNDGYTYSLYNFLSAVSIFVFGAVPIAGLKIAQLYRKELIHQERLEKENLEAEFKLKLTELRLLKEQIHPHFLFNSLNSIQALVYDDPPHAERMITQLSDFLRFSLRDKEKLFLPLGEEVKIVEKYLSMEQTRFPDRLEYSVNITDQAKALEVIAFILQPFVENAVKHGMKTSPEKLTINVKGYTEARILFLEVKNSGRWIDNDKQKGTGIKNIYARLQNAYPERHKIHIYKNPNSVHVVVEIML
jgi:LytS/YehU family sensor histidine kinase